MQDVLCIYYSRTGNTRRVMAEIAQKLNAELVEISDGVNRRGWGGWMRSGLDAVRRDCVRTKPIRTERRVQNYQMIILGTPVWAGRCSSVMRGFLKEYGPMLHDVCYVLTRGSEERYEAVYDQMDQYLPEPHKIACSLRVDSVGYDFWLEDFLRQAREYLCE